MNVFCFNCGEFIGATFLPFNRAMCELCRRIELGEIVDENAVRQYMLSKREKVDVSLLTLPASDPTMRPFSLRSMIGEVLEAVGLKKAPKKKLESVKLSEQKKRGRLFETVTLGSMEEVDKELQKQQNERGA